MTYILLIISIITTGIMNRFRGTGGELGFYKTGVGKARILVGVTIAIFSWLMAYFIVVIPFLQTLYTLGAIPLMWAGLSLGWGSYMDQGTVARRDDEIFKSFLDLFPPLREQVIEGDKIVPNPLRDFIGMALNGFVVFAPTLILFGVVYNYWWVSVPLSLVMAVVFSIIYKLARVLPIPGDKTAVAEFVVGMLMGTIPLTVYFINI